MTKRTLDSLISLSVPEVQEVFLQQMQDVVDRAMLDEMVKAIEAGDPDALFRASGFTPAALGPILDRIENVYKDSAAITVEGFPSRIMTPTGPVVFRMNMRNPAVEEDLKTNSGRLITAITQEIRDNIRSTMERGMAAGRNPRQTALDIVGRIDPRTKKRVGGVIGLTTNQERWVANTRQRLETFDEQYFNLSLRDRRFDKTIRKAFDEKKPLPRETLEKVMTSYKSSALRYRAEAISRTETIQAVNRGEYRTYMEAIDEGVLEQRDVKRWWDSTGDSKTRRTHSELEKMTRKDPIGLDEPFVTPSGDRLMHPGDTSLGAGAEEVVHCRCRVRYKVDFFRNVRDDR